MFYSAIAQDDITRKTDFLEHQGDQSFWNIVEICNGVSLHFALLNVNADPMGRIISALTESAVYHVECAVADNAPDDVKLIAESLLGKQYGYFDAIQSAFDKATDADGKEFCSGMAWKIISPLIFGLTPFPCPGKLLMEVCAAKGLPMPKLAAPVSDLGDKELDYLDALHQQGKVSLGTIQEVLAVTGADE